MSHSGERSALFAYGLAVVSVAAAYGLAQLFLYFHLPHAFAALALSAIAITFWYGGTKPGTLAALLSALVRGYLFEPEPSIEAVVLFFLVFLMFALLITQARRARDNLETRVAERTAELTRASGASNCVIADLKKA